MAAFVSATAGFILGCGNASDDTTILPGSDKPTEEACANAFAGTFHDRKLTVDGERVAPKLIEKRKGPGYADYFHQFHLETPSPGAHQASATVRHIETGAEHHRTLDFMV